MKVRAKDLCPMDRAEIVIEYVGKFDAIIIQVAPNPAVKGHTLVTWREYSDMSSTPRHLSFYNDKKITLYEAPAEQVD